jgi:hypothetical protein
VKDATRFSGRGTLQLTSTINSYVRPKRISPNTCLKPPAGTPLDVLKALHLAKMDMKRSRRAQS